MTNNEIKEKNNPPFILGYMGIVCVFFSLCAVCYHYGWLELREDAERSVEDMIYMIALMCGMCTSVIVPILFYEYDNIHPAVHAAIRVFSWITLAILIGAFLDFIKKDDIDWTKLILELIACMVFIYAWIYMLKRPDKNGKTYEDRIERKSKELRIKRYDEREVMESRSAMGLPNPGQAEMAWDNRHTYIDVKKCTIAFVTMLVLLSVTATIGKHLDSHNGATSAFTLAFVIGALMLRMFIYNLPHCAVLHGAMRYEEGVKYGLLMIGGYSVFCNILSCVIFEGSKPVWDIWGYVVFLVGTFIMFLVAYLLVTMGNKHNGHVFAFFDTDGYAKRQKDPREEEKDEEKE